MCLYRHIQARPHRRQIHAVVTLMDVSQRGGRYMNEPQLLLVPGGGNEGIKHRMADLVRGLPRMAVSMMAIALRVRHSWNAGVTVGGFPTTGRTARDGGGRCREALARSAYTQKQGRTAATPTAYGS